jgi:HEAT repeat protein
MSWLPDSPSLEFLRNQAKDLCKALRAGDPHALRRVAAHLPRMQTANSIEGVRRFRLSHALFIVAREYGFASWPKLKAHVEAQARLTAVAANTGMVARRAITGSAPRAEATRRLAEQLTEMAYRQDGKGIAAVFEHLPRRDILAVRALIAQFNQLAVVADALVHGLSDEHARVRHDCAHALDHFADNRCILPLRRLLDDPVPCVRRVAVHVLSCDACKLVPLAADDELIDHVIACALQDPSINVRRHAASALGGFRADPQAVSTLDLLLARESDAALLRNARQALRRLA